MGTSSFCWCVGVGGVGDVLCVGVDVGVGVGSCVYSLCFVGVVVFGVGFGVGCFVGGVGGGCFGGGGVVCFGVGVVVLLGSCWGVGFSLVPSRSLRRMGVFFGVTCPRSHSLAGDFLSRNLPRGLFVAHGHPTA